jgi:carbamoyl-phosphate synthase large subunit
MERRLNVLVLGVGGNVSQSIQKALRLSSVPTRVVAACITPEAPGLYLADRAYISPLAAAPEFIPWLVDVCEREQIDTVMSGGEVVLEALAPAAEMIREQTGAVSIVSPPEVLNKGRDKLVTCRWLQESGLPTPRFADLSDAPAVRALVDEAGFPLIAKPRYGKGSDAILLIRDEQHLAEVVGATEMLLPYRVTDMLLQEYLGDEQEEYTAGCFCDIDGRLCGTIVMRRRLNTGTTTSAELGTFPDVRDVAGEIAAALRPYGPCNVQLRVHQGRPVPFEINPRYSGTTALRARMGFNDVDAALRHFVLGEPVPPLEAATGGVALRYWNEVYVPAEAVAAIGRDQRLDDPLSYDVRIEHWIAGATDSGEYGAGGSDGGGQDRRAPGAAEIAQHLAE